MNNLMDKIEEILMQDELFRKHFVAKHLPKYEFSDEISPTFLGRDSHLDHVISWLKNYIGFPLIEDNFVLVPLEHSLRRQWRKELETKYGEDAGKFMKENKLRKNVSTGLWASGNFINTILGDEFPELTRYTGEIIKLTEEHSGDYIEMNISERIALTRKLEDEAYKILCNLKR